MKYASIGSISSGTLRTEDLLDTFAFELEHLVQRNADEWCSDAGRARRDAYVALVRDAREANPDTEEGAELVTELEDALDEFAPPYAYFGAHEGNGSDFGFWLSDGALEDFDGLRVSDLSEVPRKYSGEVLHINERGNMTLYVHSPYSGKLIEVWAIV
jgi:hypothetical protein